MLPSLLDCHDANGLVVISKRLKTFLEQHGGEGVECLPVRIRDHRKKMADQRVRATARSHPRRQERAQSRAEWLPSRLEVDDKHRVAVPAPSMKAVDAN